MQLVKYWLSNDYKFNYLLKRRCIEGKVGLSCIQFFYLFANDGCEC